MNKFIDYFLNYLQTEKDAVKPAFNLGKTSKGIEKYISSPHLLTLELMGSIPNNSFAVFVSFNCTLISSLPVNIFIVFFILLSFPDYILHHFFRFLHNSGYIKVNPAILIRPEEFFL